MVDIELVIKISEKDLEIVGNEIFTVDEMFESTQGRIYRAIVNGIPLPKGHGRLIDENKIWDTVPDLSSPIENHFTTYDLQRFIETAPTVIEAIE